MHPIHWHRYPYLFLVIPLISGILASEYVAFVPSRMVLYTLIGSLLPLFVLPGCPGEDTFMPLHFCSFS